MVEDQVGIAGVAERRASFDEVSKDYIVVLKSSENHESVSLTNVIEGRTLAQKGDEVLNFHLVMWSWQLRQLESGIRRDFIVESRP